MFQIIFNNDASPCANSACPIASNAFDWEYLYALAKDFLPALAIIASILMAWFTIKTAINNVQKQLRANSKAERYEAFRNKRAVAKAVMAEIKMLKEIILEEGGLHPVETVVFKAVASDIGRLNRQYTETVVRFYGRYSLLTKPGSSSETSITHLVELASVAIDHLEQFLKETEVQRAGLIDPV